MDAMPDQPSSPSPQDTDAAACDLAARLVERLRTMDAGKKGETLPPPPLPSVVETELAQDRIERELARQIKAAGRGPSSLTQSVEDTTERDNLSSSPPAQQSESPTAGMVARTLSEGSDGKRADHRLVRSPLPLPVKRRIVELFAQFQPLAAVRDTIEAEFSIRVEPKHLTDYNGDRAKHRLGKTLTEHFNACRAAYVEQGAKVAISHQAHRLRMLTSIVEKAEKSKDYNAALKGLELAAKEMGGMLDASVAKRVEHTGVIGHVHGSVEDARAEVAMRLRSMVEALPAPAASPQIEEGEFSAVSEGEDDRAA